MCSVRASTEYYVQCQYYPLSFYNFYPSLFSVAVGCVGKLVVLSLVEMWPCPVLICVSNNTYNGHRQNLAVLDPKEREHI